VKAIVSTREGWFAVDLDNEELEACDPPLTQPEIEKPGLPRVLDADASGSTVIALVDARPPLLVSYDAGTTWNESGRGLPPGVAVALSPDDPDLGVYATRDRLYLTRDGGRFWRRLEPELDAIEDVQLD
jgi:hypothetical protein